MSSSFKEHPFNHQVMCVCVLLLEPYVPIDDPCVVIFSSRYHAVEALSIWYQFPLQLFVFFYSQNNLLLNSPSSFLCVLVLLHIIFLLCRCDCLSPHGPSPSHHWAAFLTPEPRGREANQRGEGGGG